MTAAHDPSEQLSVLFGGYAAQWLNEKLFELFKKPDYLPELLTDSPCVLVGGRGTGKTTVLRCLSYEGQYVLGGRTREAAEVMPAAGFYYRINTNRVAAFRGPELSQDRWRRLFEHFLNLELCDRVLEYLEWYSSVTGASYAELELELSALSLKVAPVDNSVGGLRKAIRFAAVRLGNYLGNVKDDPWPGVTVLGTPIDTLVEAIRRIPAFSKKQFFFLIDEYENLDDGQQQVFNTLIKHSGTPYTFKIGVRELGWRCRTTINETEYLTHPADYRYIHITEALAVDFSRFALGVCNERLRRLQAAGLDSAGELSIEELLPGLSEEEEAKELGVEDVVRASPHIARLGENRLDVFRSLGCLEQYYALTLADRGEDICDVVDRSGSPKWRTDFGNYKYALLFTIKKGTRGTDKYYAGWRVFTLLSGVNIRYLLELVETSIKLHIRAGKSLGQPISPQIQTEAARHVGDRNRRLLEGISLQGARLGKLVLGLGRIFQVLARTPGGHTVEVNQFKLSTTGSTTDIRREVEGLLNDGVRFLALIRYPGDKLQAESETRDYHYMLHPIYSAFFEYSHRKKRHMSFSEGQVIGLVERPKETIREILSVTQRSDETSMPEQMELFGSYYGSPR